MKIFNKNNQEIIDVIPDDNSVRVRSIMQNNSVTLNYSHVEHVEIPVYSYINYQGERYTLWRPQNFIKHGSRNHEYTVVFGGYEEASKKEKYKFLSAIPYELKFSVTAKPADFIQILVDNLNLHDSGWQMGDCIEAPEKYLSFNHEYCWDVLQRLAGEFNTEWEITGKTIHFCKVEHNRDNPLPLSYGRGNGFVPGVGRRNRGNKSPVTVLYVQGGSRNIDFARYGSKTLLLPKSETLEYGGRTYRTDEHGMYITRADRALTTHNEDSYDASDIYPSRVGTVSEVIVADAAKNLYDFRDTSIPASLNFEDCLIPGEKMTVIFQKGALTGREFDVKYIHADRRFEIVPAQMDGFDMPDGNFKPATGDTYAVFHVMLPEAYVCDNVSESGGSWDMFREAVRYLYDVEEEQFSFTGEMDGVWSRKNWLQTGGKVLPGGYVSFTDDQFQAEPVLIRITGVTDYINNPYSPRIDLSNAPVGGFIGSDLGKLAADEVVNEARHAESIRYAQRRYRDTVELGEALERMFKNFTGGINPAFVRTMQLLVGDERLQLRFVNSKTGPVEVDHVFIYNDLSTVFSTGAGIIQHMTLGIDSLAPDHNVSEYRFWDMAAYASPPLTGMGALWLYARCGKTGTAGTFQLSAEELQDTEADYLFPIGYLNSEYEGTRSFVSLYGFVEITPGQVRANRLVSLDGTQFFDMLAKRFKIGNGNSFLSFNVDAANQLVLKGTVVQSPAGDTDFLGVDRGNYVANTTYYPGDLVKYTNGNVYKCIAETETVPTNATYWKLMISKGDTGVPGDPGRPGTPGTDGQGYMYAYYPSNSLTPPSSPPTPGVIPSNWLSYPNFYSYRYLYVSQCVKTDGAWGYWTAPTLYSMKPDPGDPGPAIVYRGEFAAGSVYYSNAARRDVVKYGSTYYIYRGTDGATNGSWTSGSWENFGAQFSSVATDLLLAVNANVGGWIFKNQRLESQSGGMYLDGVNGVISSNGSGNRIEINSAGRVLRMVDSNGTLVGSWQFVTGGSYLTTYFTGDDGIQYSMQTNGARVTISIENGANRGILYQLSANGFQIRPSILPVSTGFGLPAGSIYRDSNNNLKIAP